MLVRTRNGNQVKFGHLSEAGVLDSCQETATLCGWSHVHFRPARTAHGWRTALTGKKGWPDLFLAHPTRGALAWELKDEGGSPTPEQKEWLTVLAQAGIPVAVIWPSDVAPFCDRILFGQAPLALPAWIWRPATAGCECDCHKPDHYPGPHRCCDAQTNGLPVPRTPRKRIRVPDSPTGTPLLDRAFRNAEPKETP